MVEEQTLKTDKPYLKSTSQIIEAISKDLNPTIVKEVNSDTVDRQHFYKVTALKKGWKRQPVAYEWPAWIHRDFL